MNELPEKFWDGIWAHPVMSFDYKELELKYTEALVNKFRKIVMPFDKWHHIVLFIDGVKEMDKIVVTYVPREKPSNSRTLTVGALLFLFGIVQILLGFGSLFLTESTAITLFAFTLGVMSATAGLVSWIFGVKNVS